MNRNMFQNIVILLFGIYVLQLSSSGGLAFYIHPRYFFITTLAGIVCLLVGLAGVLYQLRLGQSYEVVKWNLKLLGNLTSNMYGLSIFITLVLLLGFLFPPRALSTRAASQRVSTNNVVTTEAPAAVSRFVSQREKYGIAEWIAEINREPDLERYVGEKVNLDGFIFMPEGANQSEFSISRFVVRCCVVDATPLGLTVVFEDWRNSFDESDWVRVQGVFQLNEENDAQSLIIQAETIEAIEEPRYPYIY